jgi:hypothetical protein
MEQMLQVSETPSDWLKALESQVLERGQEGQDNYSAIAVWCSDADEHDLSPNLSNPAT